MMTINDLMNLNYPIEIYEDTIEGGYTVSFPDLPGCLTCGETIEEAIEMAQDAKRVWLEAAIEDDYEIKLPKMKKNNQENSNSSFKNFGSILTKEEIEEIKDNIESGFINSKDIDWEHLEDLEL